MVRHGVLCGEGIARAQPHGGSRAIGQLQWITLNRKLQILQSKILFDHQQTG
jgi:hypothetical protein